MGIYELLFLITLTLWVLTMGLKEDKDYKPVYRTLYTIFNWMFLVEAIVFAILSRY